MAISEYSFVFVSFMQLIFSYLLFFILNIPFSANLSFPLKSISLCPLCLPPCCRPFVLCWHLLAPRGITAPPTGPSQFVCCQTNCSCRKDGVCVWVWCQPRDAGEVAEDVLDLLLFQLAESWKFREDDDGAAVHPAAPWRDRGQGNRNRSGVTF